MDYSGFFFWASKTRFFFAASKKKMGFGTRSPVPAERNGTLMKKKLSYQKIPLSQESGKNRFLLPRQKKTVLDSKRKGARRHRRRCLQILPAHQI